MVLSKLYVRLILNYTVTIQLGGENVYFNNRLVIAFGLILLMFMSNVSLEQTLAKEVENNNEHTVEGSEVEENLETDEESDIEDMPEIEVVKSLSLSEAIKYNEESNFSLLKLENNLENIKSQLAGTEDKFRDIKFDIRNLEREMDRLRKYGGASFQERYQIQEMLKELDEVQDELEEGIEGLKTSETITEYMNEQTDVSLPSQVKTSFLQLIMQEEQITLLEENLAMQKTQAANLKREYELGQTAKNEYDKAMRDVVDIEAKIDEATDKLNNDVTIFCLDIGIVCDDDLTLKEPHFGEIQLITQQTDTAELIENSYSMKIAEEELELERYMRDRVYDDEDANRFDREQADLAVELELIELAQLKRDAEKSIHELFGNIKEQFYSIEEAERELNYTKQDIADMKKRYEIGFISKQEYELFSKQIAQAEITKRLEQYQYYLLAEQAELLESGIILVD